jgi:hypothetical protein
LLLLGKLKEPPRRFTVRLSHKHNTTTFLNLHQPPERHPSAKTALFRRGYGLGTRSEYPDGRGESSGWPHPGGKVTLYWRQGYG